MDRPVVADRSLMDDRDLNRSERPKALAGLARQSMGPIHKVPKAPRTLWTCLSVYSSICTFLPPLCSPKTSTGVVSECLTLSLFLYARTHTHTHRMAVSMCMRACVCERERETRGRGGGGGRRDARCGWCLLASVPDELVWQVSLSSLFVVSRPSFLVFRFNFSFSLAKKARGRSYHTKMYGRSKDGGIERAIYFYTNPNGKPNILFLLCSYNIQPLNRSTESPRA